MKDCAAVFILLTVLFWSSYAQDTVQVKAGWNLVGSVKEGTIPDVLFTNPDSIIVSSFYGYAPGVGYEPQDTLGNGYGYWVKVTSDGVIIFNTTPAIDSCKSKAFIYEGRFYHTVLIGDQCWMAENLDAGVMVAGVTEQTDNDTTEKYCYNNEPLNCALYGGLYQWSEAMQYTTIPGGQGICPAGWHLPTIEEYGILLTVVGGDGNGLKAIGQGLPLDGDGTNSSGFSALLAGSRRYSGERFDNLSDYGDFWSSSELSASIAVAMGLRSITDYVGSYSWGKNFGFSVRCLED